MQKKITMAMLAKELGLSESAVSKALNNYPDISPETKKMVQDKASELGYSPNIMARSLAKKTSSFLGIVIRDVSSIYGEMFKSLNAVARRYGLHLILYDTNNDPQIERECVQNLIDSMALGIVVVPVSEDISELSRMTRGRVPVVFLGGKVRDNAVNYVCSDNAVGTQLAMDHLIHLGHRKIALLCDHKVSDSRSRKMQVYRQTMAHLGVREQILFSSPDASDMVSAGYRLGLDLLRQHKEFTALFAMKDLLAVGAIHALREQGFLVPQQISVVGYDDIDAAALPLIGLTSVSQPRMEMAEQIIRILLRHAQDPSLPPEHYLARPELSVRQSTQAV